MRASFMQTIVALTTLLALMTCVPAQQPNFNPFLDLLNRRQMFSGTIQSSEMPFFGLADSNSEQDRQRDSFLLQRLSSLNRQLYYIARTLSASTKQSSATCNGVVCVDPTTNYVYDSCELRNFGYWNQSTCAPGSKILTDCIGVICIHNNDGSSFNSCDLRQYGFDGVTCAPGSTMSPERTMQVLQPVLGNQLPALVVRANDLTSLQQQLNTAQFDPFQRQLRFRFADSCQGVMCYNSEANIAYSSCELKRFGFDGQTCLNGFSSWKRCGSAFDGQTCPSNQCCSQFGWCGTSKEHCNVDSASEYVPPSMSGDPRECGPGVGSCSNGECCSKWGFCGTTAEYCNANSLSGFASPSPSTAPTPSPNSWPQMCGSSIGSCPKGQCCSQYGYCGTGVDFCNANSQANFSSLLGQTASGDNAKCGPGIGKCTVGECCSKYGFCGVGPKFCNSDSLLSFSGALLPVASGTTPECGPGVGVCKDGQCCSIYGFCGTGPEFCNANSLIGSLAQPSGENPKCGPGIGGCSKGECCSKYGFCGTGSDYCNENSIRV